jgi:acyl-CoA thioesterase-1
MNNTVIRSTAMAIALTGVLSGCDRREYLEKVALVVQGREQPAEGVIPAVGDSLTAGYGVDEAEAHPAR